MLLFTGRTLLKAYPCRSSLRLFQQPLQQRVAFNLSGSQPLHTASQSLGSLPWTLQQQCCCCGGSSLHSWSASCSSCREASAHKQCSTSTHPISSTSKSTSPLCSRSHVATHAPSLPQGRPWGADIGATAKHPSQQQQCGWRGLSAAAALRAEAAPVESWASQRRGVLPQPHFRAVLVDAAGTLLRPSEPVAEVYLRYAKAYGCVLSPADILRNFRWAYNQPWQVSTARYVGDGRPFWWYIVAEATGCKQAELAEEVYHYYTRPEAWSLAPDALAALTRMKAAGLKTAVVSNFDTRLRPLLQQLGVAHLFDTLVISAEVGAEKPNPYIFDIACERLGVAAAEAVHVGDDRRNDVFGARDAGCTAWMWGEDVMSFDEVADRVLHDSVEEYE